MELSESSRAFVSHFGEMGSRWGFNRTVGQMLALLVIHPKSLNSDEISSALHISRGNVSMGLKELQSWRLIQMQHVPGDRKDYYTSSGSMWDMAKTVFEERRKREIDPTLSMLRTQLLNAAEDNQQGHEQEQMKELLELLEHLTAWSQQLSSLSASQLQGLIKLGSGVGKVIDLKDKLLSSTRGSDSGSGSS